MLCLDGRFHISPAPYSLYSCSGQDLARCLLREEMTLTRPISEPPALPIESSKEIGREPTRSEAGRNYGVKVTKE